MHSDIQTNESERAIMSSAGTETPLWEPSPELLAGAEMTRFMAWAGVRRGRPFADYGEL